MSCGFVGAAWRVDTASAREGQVTVSQGRGAPSYRIIIALRHDFCFSRVMHDVKRTPASLSDGAWVHGFAEWAQVLRKSALPESRKRHISRGVVEFLRFCRSQQAPCSVALAKVYIARSEAQGGETSLTIRTALRWFFRNAATAGKLKNAPASESLLDPGPVDVPGDDVGRSPFPPRNQPSLSTTDRSLPSPAAQDLGTTDWERALVRAVRSRHLLWRTEQTYRMWAQRFAQAIAPQSPYRADKSDLTRFLTSLAVEQRASPATQRQALNALIFLLEKALNRMVGDLDFKRAHPKRRAPVVLSRDECGRLFGALSGTSQLMAELAYGAGLRLTELLRLRVQDVDQERARLMVRAGKGDKDRVSILPLKLQERLESHLARLRTLHQEDRERGLPGVWLPEGLAKKYPGAALRWEWQWLFPSRELSTDPVSGIRRRDRKSVV